MKLGPQVISTIGLATMLLAGTAVHAAPLTNLGLTGGSSIAWTVSGTNLVNSGTATDASLADLLSGSETSPGGNVELSKFGGPVTTLTGESGAYTFALSSLTYNDWFGNSKALATSYITQAAATVGLVGPLFTAQMLIDALTGFETTNAWTAVSDPNLSYVDFANQVLTVGLAGYQNARPVLASLFPTVTIPPGFPVQVSEVVKLSVNDGPATYLFGFSAQPSGLGSTDTPPSFTGTYEVTADVAALAVPEPGSIALLGLGLLGLIGTARRRNKR